MLLILVVKKSTGTIEENQLIHAFDIIQVV